MIWFTLALFAVSFIAVAFLTIPPKIEFENARAAELDPNNLPRATEFDSVPLVLGRVEMNAPNTIWYGDFEAVPITESVTQRVGLLRRKRTETFTVGYRYFLGFDLGLALGPSVVLRKIILDGKDLWEGNIGGGAAATLSINNPSFFGGEKEGGGFVSFGTFYPGSFDSVNQPKDIYLVERLGAENVPAYLGTSHIVFNKAEIGEQPALRKISFILECFTSGLGVTNPRLGDEMNCGEAIFQIMTDTWRGLGIDPEFIDLPSLRDLGNRTAIEGNGCSVVVSTEKGGGRVIQEILRQVDGVAYQDPLTGKIRFALIRNDYDTGSLPEFDEDDIIAVRSFTRTSWNEVFSQVKVLFPQREREGEAIALAQDSAVISMLGKLKNSTVSFPFVYDPENANRLAARELAQISVPLFRFTLEMNRNAYFLKPGDVIKISWPDYGLSNIVLRVRDFDSGALLEGKIVVNFLQDRFAVGDVVFAQPEPSLWVAPQVNPTTITVFNVVEMPYFFFSSLSELPEDGDVLYIPLVRKPGLASDRYSMLSSIVSGSLITRDPDSIEYRGYGTLSAALNLDDGQATGFISGPAIFLNGSNSNWRQLNSSDSIRTGNSGLIYVNGEWMSFETSTTVGGDTTLNNVRRGLLGTRPRTHAAGSRCYEFDISMAGGGFVELSESQNYFYKLIDQAGGITQDQREVAEFSLLSGTLANRPVRPAFLQVDNSRVVVINDQIDKPLTWRSRNRKSELVSFEDDAAEVPDLSEIYDVDIFVNGSKNNALSSTNVTSPYTIPFSTTSIASENVEIRVYSKRTLGNTRLSADYGLLKITMNQSAPQAPELINFGAHVIQNSVTSITAFYPTGILTGDLILAVIMTRSALTIPSGWTLVDSIIVVSDGVSQTLSIISRIAPSELSGAINFTQASSGRMIGQIINIRSSNPINISSSKVQSVGNEIFNTGTILASAESLIFSAFSMIGAATSGSTTIIQPTGYEQISPRAISQNRMSISHRTVVSGYSENQIHSSPGTNTSFNAINLILTTGA